MEEGGGYVHCTIIVHVVHCTVQCIVRVHYMYKLLNARSVHGETDFLSNDRFSKEQQVLETVPLNNNRSSNNYISVPGTERSRKDPIERPFLE